MKPMTEEELDAYQTKMGYFPLRVEFRHLVDENKNFRTDIIEWQNTVLQRRCYRSIHHDHVRMVFETENDRMLFKLKWIT